MTSMIKSIIEKVILSKFGKFIKGIEKDKLSVDLFGGAFQLENISLNHDYFDSLDTPFRLAFSSIGKLNLQVPLTQFSSAPVQCTLDNIYAIFKFKDEQKEQNKQQLIRNKKEYIIKQVGEVFQFYLKKIKEQKKEDGRMAKMGKKILDNLQLKIVNVHIRFEQAQKSNPYAWGFTLQEISFTTADNNWKIAFVDRSTQESKKQKLYKMMNVKKLNFYWQSGFEKGMEILITKRYSESQKKKEMADIIRSQQNVILSLTSEFKLIMNPLQNLKQPLYELQINLQPIYFELQRLQLIQIRDFAHKNVVQNELILKKMQKKSCLSEKEIQKYKIKYQQFIQAILFQQESNGKVQNLKYDEEQLKEIFEKIHHDELMIWLLLPIKRKVKSIRQIELIKKKSGWFSRGSNQLTQQEQDELQKFIQESFESQKYIRPTNSLFFRINLAIRGGRFIFVDKKQLDIQEKIEFNIGKIYTSFQKTKDQSFFSSKLQITSVNLSICLPYEKKGITKRCKMQIMTNEKPKQYIQDEKDEDSMESFDSCDSEEIKEPEFIKIEYQNQLIQNNTIVKKSINGNIQRVTITYKRLYLQKFRKFFSLKDINKIVKNAKIQKIENSFEESFEEQQQIVDNSKIEKILDLKLKINSPVIICPLNEKQCWCLNLGELAVESNCNTEISEYPFKINSAYLRYYPNIKSCYNAKAKEFKKDGVYSVINDIDFSLFYQKNRLTSSQTVSIDLPSFNINFTQKQYDNLLSLSKVFKIEDEQKKSMLEILKEARKQIEQQMSFQGVIWKKHSALLNWREFYGIISGEYLYLYNNKKQLRETEKIHIKNSKLLIKNQGDQLLSCQNQIQDDAYELQLINQHEVCYFKCDELNDLVIWKMQIEKKSKQFKSIIELMNNYDPEQKGSNRKKRFSSQISENEEDAVVKKRVLKFNIYKVEFRYYNDEDESILEFLMNEVQFRREQMLDFSEKTFKMKELKIIDRIFKFKNPNYQHLMIAKQTEIQIIKPAQGKKNKTNKKYTIRMIHNEIFINWKPDVLLILMRLMSKHFSVQKKLRVDDDIEQTREQNFNQVRNDSKFKFLVDSYLQKGKNIFVKQKREQYSSKIKWVKERLKICIQIGKISLNMIHRESHLAMLKMISEQLNCEIVLCESQKFISGNIMTLDLFDLTGYPRKNYSSGEDYEPYQIIRRIEQDGDISKPLIEFRWSSYSPMSLPNQERVDSFLYVLIEPLEYVYFQQITFRMIDYLLIQIILLLTQPEMLTVNENLLNQINKNQEVKQKPIKIVFSQYEEIIKKMINPFFMDMYFKLKGVSIVFKSQKTSHIYYKTKIKKLIFENKNIKNAKRFSKNAVQKQIKNLIYEEQYIIKGMDCHFYQIIQKDNRRVSEEDLFEPFELDVTLNKLIFEDELNLIFPEVSEYDRSFVTINHISDIIIQHYSRLQYLNVNKLVNFNFTFDDENDELFIHNFKITKLSAPKPIYYEVKIPKIVMIADYDSRENSSQIWKLFKATINNYTMIYRRTKSLSSSFGINFGKTQFTGYEYDNITLQQSEHELIDILTNEGHNSAEIEIENKTTGQKLIKMDISRLNCNIRTGLLQLIFQYTLLEDWVFPTINKLVPEMSFYSTIHNMEAILEEDPKYIIQILQKQKTVNIKRMKQIAEKSSDLRFFKLEGLMIYKFHRRKNFSIQQFKQRMERKQTSFDDFQKMPSNAYMNIILNTEVFRGSTKSNSKRKIIEKFTFTMNDERFFKVANEEKYLIKNISKRSMNIDRCYFKASFKDIIFMQNILNQILSERKYIEFLNKKTGKYQQINPLLLIKETQASSHENLEMKVETLSFYLINSMKDIFIPILKVNLNNISLTKTNTFKKDILKGTLGLSVYYYNGLIFRWEPMIEKTSLAFHKIRYFQDTQKIFGSFESEIPIMINISRQIFLSIHETLDAWKQQSQFEQKRYLKDDKEIEPLEFISHYIVRNQTGYPIDVLNQKRVLIKQVPHKGQMDYQLQVQNYDDQNQIQFFISIRLIHPTYKFKIIGNISFNSEREYEILPRQIPPKEVNSDVSLVINQHSKIVIKREFRNTKKILLIKSCKYVYTYLDNSCKIEALPFDHPQIYTLPQEIHNSAKVSLYEQRQTSHYRYIGKNGILKIMKKHIVYNYSPLPLKICGSFVMPNEYIGISDKLKIQQIEYKASKLKTIKNQKLKEYYIYSECYIVDYYGLKFDFGHDTKNIDRLYSTRFKKEGVNFFVYCLPQTQYKFKVAMEKSTPVELKTTIGKSNFKIQTGKALCYFSLYSYLSPLNNEHLNEFRRVIQITPQYMLSNATKSLIKICQVESCDSISLEPYQRIPFFWENKYKPMFIKISSYDGKDFWGYSGNLTIEKSTETIVLRKSNDPTVYRIFSIYIQVTSTVSFIHFIEPSPKYILENHVPGTTMRVYQSAIMDEKIDQQCSFPKQFIYNVRYKEEKPYGYEMPLESHKVIVMIDLNPNFEEFKGVRCQDSEFEDFETTIQTKAVQLRKQKKIIGKFYLNLCFENNLKKLKLSAECEEEQQQTLYQYLVKIPRVGISLIGQYNLMRKEIIHIIFESIQLEMSGNNDIKDYNLMISRCRIENQLKNNPIFPVIFQSSHSKKAKYFINFLLSRSAKNTRLIHYIGISVNKNTLTISSEEVQVLQQNLAKILELKLQGNKEKQFNFIRDCQIFDSDIPDPQESLYFVEAVIHPLKSVVTFRHVNQWGGKLLKTFSSIIDSSVEVKGHILKHFGCSNLAVYISLVLKHYKDGLYSNILPLIGGLTFLGSPLTFAQKIGSGLKNFIEYPSEGFQISPLEGGKGFARGTGSLLVNTMSGAFLSVESITGSISNGITSFVDDDKQFSKDRQSIKNDRSQHVIGGLAHGAKSIFNGIKNGITGVVTQPMEGAERSGLPGFLKGTVKGIAGLVIKPVSGVFDAASKTAEGIKNTPEFFSSEKQKKYNREHTPRPFYNYYKQFRNYDSQFANLIQLTESEHEKYENLSWCGYYILRSSNAKTKPVLLLSYEYLFIFNIVKLNFLNILNCQYFRSVELNDENGIVKLMLIDKKNGKLGSIQFVPDGGCRRLSHELRQIIRHFIPDITYI